MYSGFEKWLDSVMVEGIPENSVGIGFNIYEESNNYWSVQLVTTERFDEDDPDWMCDEIFSTGENLFSWQEKNKWSEVLKKSISIVNEYLKKGKYSSELKKYAAIGIGFVDGDIEILFKNN